MFIDEDDPEWRLYPDSDGKPIGDDTLHFEWVTTLAANLMSMYARDPSVFVAGDLLWYPVKGAPMIRTAPDALMAFGRPKGDRHSYKQWREGGVAPQVVFENQSQLTTEEELEQKWEFYNRYGVEEYYFYDCHRVKAAGWLRGGGELRPIASMHNWISPRTALRFDLSGPKLAIHESSGRTLQTFVEAYAARPLSSEELQGRRQKEMRLRLELQVKQGRQELEAARRRAETLAAKLREGGVDPGAD
jgi:Uma2 family endonuclease